jgi:hypothetical protein
MRVGKEGLEPSRVASYAPEAYAYANSATCPFLHIGRFFYGTVANRPKRIFDNSPFI